MKNINVSIIDGKILDIVALKLVFLQDRIGPIPINRIIANKIGPAVLLKYGAETLISVPVNSIDTTGNKTPHNIIKEVRTSSTLFNKNDDSLDK
tara:strand:- start:235 stop:516 length:282 start_codon:yes stop_codon:yes gene_type:complete